MALSVLARSLFYDKLKIVSYDFDLAENSISSMDGAGQILTSTVGPRLWQGTITIASDTWAGYREQVGMMKYVMKPNIAFHIYDKKAIYPANDPTGTITAAEASGTVSNPVAGSDSVTVAGLTPSFTFKAGDYLSIQGSGTTRYLYQIILDETTDGTGEGTFSLSHPVSANISDGATVSTHFPVCNGIYVPGSFKPGVMTLDHGEGFSFQWRQSLQ